MVERESILESKKALESDNTTGQENVNAQENMNEQENVNARENVNIQEAMNGREALSFHPPVGTPSHMSEELVKDFQRIPDRKAFRIGDVAKVVGVKPFVLRYWETEFKQLRPQKTKHNQRVYARKDVETALIIKRLRHDTGFSIEGTRGALKNMSQEIKGVSKLVQAVSDQGRLKTHLEELAGQIRQLRSLFEA